jgi:hypothetical protein
MAALSTGIVPSLVDIAKTLNPDGSTAVVAELLNQTNEIVQDVPWMEGNMTTGNRTTVRTGLPSVAWRLLNAGIQPSTGKTAQIDEQCGKMESWAQCDVALAKLSGNVSQYRLNESAAHIEAMGQEFASVLLYGNSGLNPEKFTGLSVRYSAISGAGNAQNVVDAGGTGSDNTSIWLVVWGERTIHGIYPKGSVGGLQHNDLGEETVQTDTGGTTAKLMRAYRDQFVWDCGIALKDWRAVVRVANIDVSNLVAQSSDANLRVMMIKALGRLPAQFLTGGKAVFYVNRTVGTMLDIQALTAVGSGGGLTYQNFDGRRVLTFQGVPVRTVDAILNTEARVV